MESRNVRHLLQSIRFKLIAGLIAVVLPILSFLTYNNLYSIQLVRNQVAQSNGNLLQLYMGLIDKDLESIDAYLFQFIAQDTGLNRLDRSEEQDPDRYHLARYQLFRELYDRSGSFGMLDFFFVYSGVNRDLVLAHNSNYIASADTAGVNDSLLDILQDPARMQGYAYESWSSLQTNDHVYLVRIVKSGNLYVGALVNYSRIMKPLNPLNLGTDGKLLIVDAGYEPLQDAEFIRERQIAMAYTPHSYQLTGNADKYLVIGEHSARGDFSLLAIIPDSTILENLPYTQRVIAAIAAGTILILIGALVYMRKIILQPISRILSAMRKLRDGHLEARIAGVPSTNEFMLMNDTFNSMASQIQKLKIDIYEEQLQGKKAELKHLQLQLNPHFYLNSLNAFYHLAEDNNTAVIKELSHSLIKYFRFMFRSSHLDFVPLEDELNHVVNYLRIQEFRFPGYLTHRVSVADGLKACEVPLLTLQTFVENTVKHAVTLDEPICVQVNIALEEDPATEARMRIQIRDNGAGFPEEVLKLIDEDRNLTNDAGEHVGIWNVKRRLWLLYKDRAGIRLYNDHGAVVEIVLPLEQ